MKPNDWQDTIAMAASAIEDLLETADEHAGCWADVPARLRALTAPPAPAPAVPEEIGIQEAKELFNYLMTEEELNATVNGYNACRAAMLAQPVSSGYRLVPVEPTDEQLRAMLAVIWPATYREHLRHPDNGPVSIARAEEEIKQAKEQYAAALAAAPEGGNDPDTRR